MTDDVALLARLVRSDGVVLVEQTLGYDKATAERFGVEIANVANRAHDEGYGWRLQVRDPDALITAHPDSWVTVDELRV